MIRPSASLFPRRRNDDGTYDLICPYCFMTAASHVKEDEFAAENFQASVRDIPAGFLSGGSGRRY